MEEVFRECMEEERERGRTVLLSSHILSEVEALCDRVTIIRKGRAVETGTLAELRHLTETAVDATLSGAAAGRVAGAGRTRRQRGRRPPALPGETAPSVTCWPCWPRPGSRAWSASPRPWSSCSCATHGPDGRGAGGPGGAEDRIARGPRDERVDRHRRRCVRGAAAGPVDAPGGLAASSRWRAVRGRDRRPLPDEASRAAAAELINATPALVAFYGRICESRRWVPLACSS